MPENETDWLAFCKDREEMLKFLQELDPPRAVAEIGVYKGDFSEQILQYCPDAAVFIIDPRRFQKEYKDGCNHEQEEFDQIYEACLERFERYGQRADVIRKFSVVRLLS